MVLKNIIDHRTKPYKWEKITAIIEPTAHDNSIGGADRAVEPLPNIFGYEELPKTSLTNAIDYARTLNYPATVYLYDLGDGIRVARDRLIDRLQRDP